MKLVPAKSSTPGPRDERGVLAARIAGVAREEFAEHGWAGTTMRAVARAADVDPALVYHYFGSKKGLLEAATVPPQRWLARIAEGWNTPVEELGKSLITLLLANWADEEIGPTLRAIAQTAAHEPSTREKMSRVVESSLIGTSHLADNEQERLARGGLIASQLLGFAMMRFVWKIEPIASMSEEDAIASIGPTLQRYVDGDLTG